MNSELELYVTLKYGITPNPTIRQDILRYYPGLPKEIKDEVGEFLVEENSVRDLVEDTEYTYSEFRVFLINKLIIYESRSNQ